MRLETVNVGLPQEVDMDGRKTMTSILKHQVQGPVMIYKDRIEGNKPTVHPDVVYAFSADSYQYWANNLGIDANISNYGFFGENLTISGSDDSELEIGDQLKIGNEVVLQIVAPRIPCNRLLWRVQQKGDFLTKFRRSGHIGYYLRVLQTGNVQAGDEVRLIKKSNSGMSVSDLAIFIDDNNSTEEELKKILSWEFLGVTVQQLLANRLSSLTETKVAKKHHWQGWREFVISKIVDEAEDIKSYHLVPVDNKPLANYYPGQFLVFELTIPGVGEVIRTWSISDYQEEPDHYRISIKKIPEGVASTFMHEKVSVGTQLKVKPPAGSFHLDSNSFYPSVLICGGIGVTPLLSMLKAYQQKLKSNHMSPTMCVFYTIKDAKNAAFLAEIKQALESDARFISCIAMTQEQDESKLGDCCDKFGHLTMQDIETHVKKSRSFLGGKEMEIPMENCIYYLCGPKALEDSFKAQLLNAGVLESHIKVESFIQNTDVHEGHLIDQAEIEFKRSGKTLVWNSDDAQTILELAEKNNISIDNSCRMGVCQTCETTVLEGDIYYDSKPLGDHNEKLALLCSAKPGSKKVVLDA